MCHIDLLDNKKKASVRKATMSEPKTNLTDLICALANLQPEGRNEVRVFVRLGGQSWVIDNVARFGNIVHLIVLNAEGKHT